MAIIKLFIIIFPFFVSSYLWCQDKFEDHFICLHALNQEIIEGDWEFEQHYTAFDLDYYSFFAEIADTVYSVSFYVKIKELLLCRGDYFIVEFYKEYCDSCYKHFLYMNVDTIYYYKTLHNYPNCKIFIIGKYDYLFANPRELKQFSKCQQDFFYDNLDSLLNTRGSGPLELPPCKDNHIAIPKANL